MTAGLDEVAGATAVLTVAEIYEKQFAFVWRNLRRLGIHQSALEDAAHDVFLVVVRRLHQFEQRSSLQTWMFGIVHNIALDYRRKQAKDGLADDSVELISARATPEENRQRQESLLFLNGLLSKLDLEQRTVFIMIDIEEFSAQETANALSIKLNTVYSRLRLARRAFDVALQRASPQLRKNG